MYKALAIREIIESLTDPSHNVDVKLLNIFLYTYRPYCSALDIIKLFDERFYSLIKEETLQRNIEERNGFTNAVIMFINSWLTLPFAYDFYEQPHFDTLNILLKSIREWPIKIVYIRQSKTFISSFVRLEEKLKALLKEFSTINIEYREVAIDCSFGESVRRPGKYSRTIYLNFMDNSPQDIAEALTFLDTEILRKLRLPELLLHAKNKTAASVRAVIDNYNELYNVVKTLVMHPQNARLKIPHSTQVSSNIVSRTGVGSGSENYSDDRLNIIETWIYVAQFLLQLNNYSSLIAIITALNSSDLRQYISHFKRKKSSKLYSQYLYLVKIVEPSVNIEFEKSQMKKSDKMPNYLNRKSRNLKAMKQIHSEIPYLGVYLRHLSYIDDAFPDWLNPDVKIYDGGSDKLVNIDKCRKQFDVLAQVRLCITSLSANLSSFELSDATPESKYPFLNWYNIMRLNSNTRENGSFQNNSRTFSVDSLASMNSDSSFDLNSADFKNFNVTNSKSQECLSVDVPRYHNKSRTFGSVNHSPCISPFITSSNQSRNIYKKGGDCMSVCGVRYGFNDDDIDDFDDDWNEFHHGNKSSSGNHGNISSGSGNYSNISSSMNQLCVDDKEMKGHGETSTENNIVATVKLKMIQKFRGMSLRNHQAQGHGTVTGASMTQEKSRPPLPPSIKRSHTSSAPPNPTNLANIVYKKIQIFESDHTSTFIKRVLHKFNKLKLDHNDFNVYQLFDGKELKIPPNTNLYYALAAKSEYKIEVRHKEYQQ